MNVSLAVPTIDNFKEVMNTAPIAIPTYIPGAITDNKDTGGPNTFVKELAEKTDQIENADKRFDKEMNTPPIDLSDKNPRLNKEPGNVETKETKVNQPVPEKPGSEELREQGPGQREKTVQETGSEKNHLAAQIKNNIKEIIREHQLQSIEFARVKENTRENFGIAKKISSNRDIETLMLKSLVDPQEKSKHTKVNVDPAKVTESQTGKTTGEKNSEAVIMEKKDNASASKNESTAEKKANSTDNGIFNITGLNTREAQLSTQAKLQALLPRYNILEQYEALKEKIVNSVENSIKFMITEGENKVGIKLYPPELGKIQVELVIKDNQINARINTENIAVKEAILTNLDQLKSNIESAGIIVHRFDVEVGGFRNPFDRQFSN
ncbi:MAG TPA: flagellar hook-length control protein FliK, partial [Candidatus Kapabacteria bacterium]|nr:flagellar hook-length control protein FliK [Candidatus Kapabacteria bacterium]